MTVALAVSAGVGLLVAVVELYGRYRVYPWQAILSLPGLAYIILNVTTSVAALAIASSLGWSLGPSQQAPVVEGVLAGLGGMAILRSSLFVFQQGETQVDIGPSALLAGLRTATDRHLDQRHASSVLRSGSLQGLEFARHHEPLTLLCQSALVNPDPELAIELGDLAARLKADVALDDSTKMKIYSMALVRAVGTGPVEQARRLLVTETPPMADASEEGAVEPAGRSSAASAAAAERRRAQTDQVFQLRKMIDVIEADTDDRDTRLLVDLYLRRACLFQWLSPSDGPWAFSEVPFDDAQRLLGAETVLSTSTSHAVHRLLPLIQWDRVSTPGITTKSVRQRAESERRPRWLVAAALTEIAQRLAAEPDLQLPILNAAIDLEPAWDARVLRADVHLRLGDRPAALRDIRSAGRPDHGLKPLMAIGHEKWDPVLGALTPMLGDEISDEALAALWNSAVRALRDLGESRPIPLSRPSPLLSTLESRARRLPDEGDLKQLLTDLAQRVPTRSPTRVLSRSDFSAPSTTPGPPPPELPGGVTDSLRERFGTSPQLPDVVEAPTTPLESRLPLMW